MKIKVGEHALSDHIARLYESSSANSYVHVDGEHAGRIDIIKRTKTTVQVMMSEEAIKEFVDDMDYQVEFMDSQSDRAYRNQCRRALASVRKQLTEGK